VKLGAALAATLAAAAVASAAVSPHLRIAARAPLQLAGTGFRPGELVSVRVDYADETYRRKARAANGGTFSARFPEIRLARCGRDLAVGASGNRGSRVRYTLHQLACAS
jgi:hypothetical protein